MAAREGGVLRMIGRSLAASGFLAGLVLAHAALMPGGPAWASNGCALTFRHGGSVQAERCEDQGEAIAYLRFGGWVVVQKASLASLRDERGITQLNPLWTAEELRAQTRALPKEGGVPLGPTGVAPYVPPPAPAPPPAPQVVYVPVPVPAEPILQVTSAPVFFSLPAWCPHCLRRHHHGHHKPLSAKKPFVRVVPTNPMNIGPMAIQKHFPPISPLR